MEAYSEGRRRFPRSMPDMRRKRLADGKFRRRHFPPGKVLSCRVFDPEKTRLVKEARSSGWRGMDGLFQGSLIGLETVKAADTFHPEPSLRHARGPKEWAGEASRVANGALFCTDPEDVWGVFSQPAMPGAVGANVRDNGAGAPCRQEQKQHPFIVTFLVFAAWTADQWVLTLFPFHKARDSIAIVVALRKAGNARVNAMFPRPGERHSFRREMRFRERFGLLDTKHEIRTALCLRGGSDDQLLVVLQFANPRIEIRR